ncbi:MAG: hypothetical protein AUF79_13595 [Crenarchaeota archaeon 13_1_20CM_2_51_8]|nr:MAG: hypothetical protein AUF79_13595 [Crenarchaeota archaeon 13_1_20CM_2_51_8]
MDLTGFMFSIIEQSEKEPLKPPISPNFESKGDTKVACDDRLRLSEAGGLNSTPTPKSKRSLEKMWGKDAFGIGLKETPEATTPVQFFRPEQAT